MKNKAFTLAEAMIVLSIVSVLSALSITAVSNAKPDESIVMFRRGYAMLTRIVNELINDEELFPDAKENIHSNVKFGNAGQIKGLADYTVDDDMKSKYPCLTTSALKIPALIAFKANSVTSATSGTNTKTFTTPDGMYWQIVQQANQTNYNSVVAVADLRTNGANTGCFYDATSCKVPTNFRFNIYNNGKIEPITTANTPVKDPMACSYIRYTKVNKAKNIPTTQTANSCF